MAQQGVLGSTVVLRVETNCTGKEGLKMTTSGRSKWNPGERRVKNSGLREEAVRNSPVEITVQGKHLLKGGKVTCQEHFRGPEVNA